MLDLKAHSKEEEIRKDMDETSKKLAALYNCPFCFHVYTKTSSVNDHVKSTHPDAVKPYRRRVKCPEKAKLASRKVKWHI